MMSADALEDPGQGVIRKVRWERCASLNEVELLRSVSRAPGWGGNQHRSRLEALDLGGGTWVRGDELLSELMKNGDPDPGSQCNLVTNTDPAHSRWQLDRIVLPEKSGEKLPDPGRRGHRAHLDVVNCAGAGTVLDGVTHEQDGEVQPDTVSGQDLPEEAGNLLSSSLLPFTREHLAQSRETHDGHPVLLSSVDNPIVELQVLGDLDVDIVLEGPVPGLEIGQAIIMLANGFLNMDELDLRGSGFECQDGLGLVEQVEDIMKARNRGQMDTVRREVLADEAWKKIKIGGPLR